MSGAEHPRDADIEQANWQLDQGLKSCRSVVDNYRSMLSGDNLIVAGIQAIDPGRNPDALGEHPN